jgi:hypothetical protein
MTPEQEIILVKNVSSLADLIRSATSFGTHRRARHIHEATFNLYCELANARVTEGPEPDNSLETKAQGED